MTDRELLEYAAKAAGIKMADNAFMHSFGCAMLLDDGSYWNPLTDDGDALRLAVKLRMIVMCYDSSGEDQYAATRRTIVRTAAEIGKQMP